MLSAETVEKVQFLHFSKFAYNNIKHLEVYKLPFSGFSTVSL
jgi:tartrate dehydratase beta subunit/fumarate hydratase class I family protein